MRIYIINSPFFTKEGQFEEGKHTLVGGIEVNALKKAGEYRVYIGNNRHVYYDITYTKAMEIYAEYGMSAMTQRGSKKVFILPIKMMKMGVAKGYHQEVQKREDYIKDMVKEDKQVRLF